MDIFLFIYVRHRPTHFKENFKETMKIKMHAMIVLIGPNLIWIEPNKI